MASRFMALDGEGITARNGRHRYIMAVAHDGERYTWLQSAPGRGLSTNVILSHVYRWANDTGSIPVIYGGSYDVNMWLVDWPRRAVKRVWEGEQVSWAGWTVQYRARKSFRFRPSTGYQRETTGTGRVYWHAKDKPVTVWDVLGFFQSPFVDALEKYLPDWPDLPMIRAEKQRRRLFRDSERPVILDYCRAECRALVAVMDRLHDYVKQSEITLRRWDGAGAIAAALLQREGVKAHLSRANPIETPRIVNEAARHAYAGGRIELIRYGHAPDTLIHHYDINSAYPDALRRLPSLAHGRWVRGTGDAGMTPDAVQLLRIRWKFQPAALYPFAWRAPSCAIYFPPEGETWCWSSELYAATAMLDAGHLKGKITVLDGWTFQPSTMDRPFHFVEQLYRQRQEWKAAGLGAEKVLKLGINSLYGKTAQQVGGQGGPPAWHDLLYAGFVTGWTRSTIYRVMAPVARDHGIMLATDGIYSTCPLNVTLGSGLGEWSYEIHRGMTVVQSGVYWTDKGERRFFCRGFDRGSLKRRAIVDAWRRHRVQYKATLTRFVGMGTACRSPKSWPEWATWRTAPRILALTMRNTKRSDRPGSHPAKSLVLTDPVLPAAFYLDPVSAPYPIAWEDHGQLDGASLRLVEQEAADSYY